MSYVTSCIWLAGAIAALGCAFGICMARMLWADDLESAKSISRIDNETMNAMKSQISSLERIIEIQGKTIAIQKQRLGE